MLAHFVTGTASAAHYYYYFRPDHVVRFTFEIIHRIGRIKLTIPFWSWFTFKSKQQQIPGSASVHSFQKKARLLIDSRVIF